MIKRSVSILTISGLLIGTQGAYNVQPTQTQDKIQRDSDNLSAIPIRLNLKQELVTATELLRIGAIDAALDRYRLVVQDHQATLKILLKAADGLKVCGALTEAKAIYLKVLKKEADLKSIP